MLNGSNYVTLAGGLTVPLAALQVLWALEDRGVQLQLEGTDGIVARPKQLLTDADRAEIRRYRWHVLAILSYQPKELSQ
jgi:hypothetical protein